MGCFKPNEQVLCLERLGVMSISEEEHEVIRSTILQHHQWIGKNTENKYYAESHEIFGKETTRKTVTYYLHEYHEAYQFQEGLLHPLFSSDSTDSVVALTFEIKDDQMILQDYWTPLPGMLYESSIQEKFPDSIEEEVFSFKPNQLQKDCVAQAKQHFNCD